jgi:hypothetical protein
MPREYDESSNSLSDGIAEWQKSLTALDGAEAALANAWTKKWEGVTLNFELDSFRSLPADAAAISSQRQSELSAWHDSQYAELAERYLMYSPPAGMQRDLATPAGCEKIEEANADLAGLLAARFELSQSTQLELDRLASMAKVDLHAAEGEQLWDALRSGESIAVRNEKTVRVPLSEYAKEQAEVSLARLESYGQLDELMTTALDVQLREVAKQWERVWPDTPLFINIFEYAGKDIHSVPAEAGARQG